MDECYGVSSHSVSSPALSRGSTINGFEKAAVDCRIKPGNDGSGVAES